MAVGFKFSLESLLRMRRHALGEAQRFVAARQRKISQINTRIEQIGRDARAQINESKGLLTGTIDSRAIATVGQYVSSLDRAIESLKTELLAQERVLADERHRMIEASRRVKSLEKLRERRLAEFEQHQQRQERITEDETALNVYRNQTSQKRAKRFEFGAVADAGAF